MVSQSFPKKRRLLQPSQFQRVFDNVDHKQGGPFVTLLARQNQTKNSRIGIIVSKKISVKAVERNRIKRLIRESFRTSEFNLSSESLTSDTGAAQPTVDIIVLAKAPCSGAENAAILSSLKRQWIKLGAKTTEVLSPRIEA